MAPKLVLAFFILSIPMLVMAANTGCAGHSTGCYVVDPSCIPSSEVICAALKKGKPLRKKVECVNKGRNGYDYCCAIIPSK